MRAGPAGPRWGGVRGHARPRTGTGTEKGGQVERALAPSTVSGAVWEDQEASLQSVSQLPQQGRL